MAGSQSTSGGSPGNVQDVEPHQYSIWADYGSGGVGLEIVDSTGHGFKTILDPLVALDFTLRFMAAVMRLRGLTTP